MSSKTKKKNRKSFGATAPPFIDYLKDILRRYPDGGQILKELIQNADDAQATKVVFIHDERSYGTESLWTDELGQYQGPALYAYNNAAFTQEDWEGIQTAGRSVKRNDPNKVGRFGIGFNSVYHITDLPSIFSSKHLGFLDPQEKIFGVREGGFQWSLDDADDQEDLMTIHDQFQPFHDIVSLLSGQEWSKVIKENQQFDGTVFRFPLRKEASDISDNLYDSNKVVELFDSFIADADLSLLFLKNVISVSLIHIDVHGTVNSRLEVKSSVPSNVVLESEDESITESSTRFKVISLNSKDHKETTWLLTTCTMKEGNVEELDSLAKKLSFFPQVDLAFPCGEKRDSRESRLSCFLPLPNNESNKTGLPVYVNACFGLTDNRRHIKWQEEDQKHDEHAVWNELLMKEVLPQAYLMIIQDAIKLAQASVLPVSYVYNLWPDISQIKHREKWYAVALDVLDHLFKQNVAVLSLAKNERQFITPSEAVFPCNGPTSSDILAAIERTLVSCGENLVTLSGSVAKAINEAYPQPSTLKHVTPTFLRDILRRMNMHTISKDDKLWLLEYVLSDGKYRELKGLQLLPLNDGSFRSFTDREEDTALIDSNEFPRVLLPCCKHLFIPDDLSRTCSTHLKELARENSFKVINIDANQVAEYTKKYLPQDWKQTRTGLVTWNISSSQHPPLGWLQEFWKFLNTHFKELSNFSRMPLIPVSPLSASQHVSLARLEQKTTLIFQKSKQMNLPTQIAQLVNKVGGTVVTGNEWLKHEDLDSYVLCPSPRSVMKVLVNLDSQDVIRELKTASHKAREELKDYLSRLDSLSVTEKDLLSKLPLFQTMKGSSVAVQSKQAVLLISGLKVPTDFPMPDSVVQCANEADRRLLQLLKVNIMDTAQAANLLIDCIEKGACRKEDTGKIMTWILQNGEILLSQNQTLRRRCKDLSFIEMNGKLKKASDFFDPRIATFKVIFESDFFPPPLYTHTSQMLQSLTELGLLNKEVDVSPEHLLHAATLIDSKHVSSQAEALKRAKVLLKMLDTNDLLSKFSHEQLHRLKMLRWVPCAKPGSEHCNDKSQTSCFFCPDEIRHSMYEDIVGHAMPLVGSFSNRVSSQLGLQRLPPPEKVTENLTVLKSKAQKMFDPDTNVDFKRKLHSIYKHMQDHISEFSTMMKKDKSWLWSHNHFVSPQDLVLDYPCNLDLSAYIGKVPKEFLAYNKLLQEFGLRTLLSDEEVIGILHSIKQTIEGRQLPFATSSEVKVSIEILNWLWKEKKTVQDDIPVPVLIEGDQHTLKPLSTAVFCDVSKNGLKELKHNQEEIHVVHEEIPRAAAEWFNIQFLSTHILHPEFVGIEQCGQSEPITTRIKNILKEYDEESDIFKELIQNAEDAGAEACKFLVDFRVHKDAPDSLIDPDMTLCQGPCLWAFNNEQFTPEDWKNIVRVGAASKENKVEKIGKFGLGFNTVYHVTDVPSILSGNSLLILDPNVTHLKKHIKHKTNPGIKLDLAQQGLFRWFPGQFGPYERIFDCNLSRQSPPEPYPGTLIKLPFRTEEEAVESEISSKVYHKHNIISFQQHFTNNSQTHLLFLKNINTLSLQSISNEASTPPRDDQIETVFTVSKTTVNTNRIPDETVSKQHQAEKSLMKLDKKCKEVIDSCTVNIVQITSQQSGVTEVQSWLLYNCFGTHQSLQMALQENKQAKFSLPVGGIAVPLQKHPDTGKLASLQTDLVGQAFCFLPLSIHTGLPVNVNGTFAVTSNRKGLWESGVKHDWNKALLQDPVVKAYITALLALKEMSENKQLEKYYYHTVWPDREKVSEIFKPLVDALYSIIAHQSTGPKLFSDGEHWCSMNNAIFLHERIEEDKDIFMLAVQVCKKHIKAPNHVIPLPLWLRNSFKQSGLETVLLNRTWNWDKFYQEAVFNNLGTMDPESRDTLVLHAIDLNIKEINSLLVRYPCIPTKSGELQYIRKLVNPTGKVACLFESEKGRLLGGTKNDFCAPKRIQRLLELGMANDHLSLEDITEKASTIPKTWTTDKEKAYGHLNCLLELLKDHMNDKDSLHWETLRMTELLPAFSPGDTKMERNVILRRPTDVFSEKCSPLVNMTQHVLDHTNLEIHKTDPVLQILGVHDSPGPEKVIQQLQEACEKSQSIDRSMLTKIALECYRFLDHWLIDGGDSTFIARTANSFPFILVGSTFANVSRVAENEQFEAKPYLYLLPSLFSDFRTLWECVGVEKGFTTSQFLTVLKEMHSQHSNKTLPKKDLSICLTILRAIHEGKGKTVDCKIPNKDGVLQPASEMFYNDSPWMPVAPGVTLCHENISRVMAKHFGIKTTRHHTLQNYEIENISPFAFEFEQHEDLTVRIKNIISAYPAKKDILKELIQNADDAEATEIHFVWDRRRHGTEKTFGKKWNQLQGPALCVFNNKVFSDADLAGIQQLGEGGKHNSPGKTGKYGVGFNSVYHLTDCPSILTGDELLCISDPNRKYIESPSDKPPAGTGYRLPDTFKNMYMDVYKSFLPDEFHLKDGTMFRLPLRMGIMANNSKISQQGVTDHDMEELCSELSKDPEGLILFLKNICKIKVHEINEHSGQLKTIFVVEKSLPQKCSETKDAFVKLQQIALQSDTPVTPKEVIYGTLISTSDKRQTTWIIAEQFGSSKNNGDDELTPLEKLPQAAIAAQVSSKIKSSDVAPPSPIDFKGEAFCSLPLPGKTGLPVHVNANFEVDSARRNLWKEDGQGLKSNWNEYLKQNVIAPLYADLLHYISCSTAEKKVDPAHIESHYLCFWPTVSKYVGQDWHEMIHEVYRSIKERGLNVIPFLRSSTQTIGGHEFRTHSLNWCDVKETETTQAPYLLHWISDEINPILEDLGMKLVPPSMLKVWKSFKSAGIELNDVNPSTVRTFLREKRLNDSTQTDEGLPLPVSATLIKDATRCSTLLSFCLRDFDLKKTNSSSLNGLPLLLTRDNVLRVFNSKSPKLISRYDRLFSGYEDQFADHKTNREHIKVLETLNLVKSLTLPCAAEYLKPLIQQRLQNCEVDPHSGLHVPNENMMNWLKSLWAFLTSQIKPATSGGDEQSPALSDVRQLFNECCILPVVCPRLNNKHFLQAMKDMPSVIQFATDRDISSILFKLGFLKLNNGFFSEIHVGRQDHSLLHSELMNVNDQGCVLDQVYNINRSEFSQLSIDEMKELQFFLQSGISKSKDKQAYQRKLKSLPLFETVHGNRVRIDGLGEVFILHSIYSKRFPDLFNLPNSNSIFLKNNPENCSLSETLNIKTLTDMDYFMKFILPIVHTFTEIKMLHCLKLLLSLPFQSSDEKDTIISSMKTVKLIRNSQGSLEAASYYFDESVELYRKMLPQERFVPQRFWTELCEENPHTLRQLKDLLRDLGMKSIVSKDDIITFAQQLETEAKGNGQLKELKQKSSLIFKAAWNIVCYSNKEERLLESIADIKFMFPVKIQKELCNYHQPFAAEKTAVKIRGSLMDGDAKHQELIWSSMPIIDIPVHKSPMFLKMMKNAGAHEQPPTLCVTSNMSNICQSPCKTDQLIETRAKVFRSAYAYLQANVFQGQQLAGLPVVLVEKDKEIVRPDDASFSLPHHREFRPYLYSISSKDVMFEDFFRKIGVKDRPTAVQYCNVLEAVYVDSCEKPQLNPNQQITVKRAVEQFFKLIKTPGDQTLVDDVKTLYLPAVDGKLYPSHTLYYNDTACETKRLEKSLENKFLLLEKLSECHLGSDRYEHHRLLQLLPEKFRPKMLTQITEERVEEAYMQFCELEPHCEFSGWFEKHLSSGAFTHGLICLIREQSQGKITQEEATDMCKKTFGSIRIVCCESLKTKLFVNKQPLHKTAIETNVFVKREQQVCIFYLKHNNDIAPKVINRICMTLAKEINALLGMRMALDHLLVLGQLLLCDSLQDVLTTLAENGIHDSAETASNLLNPPAPGTEIPEEWHDSLDMNILNNFEEGEYVGYSTNNKYIYAVIVEELPRQAGLYSQRYRIDIGEDEPVEVSCLDLYQFKRQKKTEPEERTCTSAESSCTDLVPLSGAVPHSSQPSNTSSSSSRSSPASIDEAKQEIDKCLAEIWTLPKEEKDKAIKRLYLRWHPDKNPDCPLLATEAFKYLKNQIDELSKGKGHGKGNSGGSSYPSGNFNFSDHFRQWDQEARYHRNSRERFSRGSYNFWTHNDVPKPNKEEAQRWCRQARCDLNAAQKDMSGASTEWCLFKIHQAVEKSLIAAKYKKDGQHPTDCSISALAAKVSLYNPQLRVLPEIVRNLKTLGVDAKKTQYPNCHPFPHIPNDRFKSENEMLALDKASELLSKVEAYVN
ncbi:sacsin-like [Centropristis striata]|uniref:sacsin-like n=1 Tax=Centropristis striata TaxID=184440 RepID=UPI0027E04BB8|nr:sacsin-like [Centropristis striata]